MRKTTAVQLNISRQIKKPRDRNPIKPDDYVLVLANSSEKHRRDLRDLATLAGIQIRYVPRFDRRSETLDLERALAFLESRLPQTLSSAIGA